MPQLEFLAQAGAGWGTLGTDIRDLFVRDTTAGPVVLVTTGPGGGMMSLRWTGTQLQVLDTVYFSGPIAQTVTGIPAFLSEGGQSYAIVGKGANGDAVGYTLTNTGAIGAATSLDLGLHVGTTGPVIATSDSGYVYTVTAPGRLQGFDYAAGSYTLVATIEDTSTLALAAPVALHTVSLSGKEFLIALSDGDHGVTALQVSAATGALSVTGSAGVATGLGLLATPTGLQIAEVDGKTYVVVASAADQGKGGALSVLQLHSDGSLQVTDHILDGLLTRFGKVTELEVIEVAGWTYVVAGGGDAGLSLFTLAPGGRLLHLDTLEDTLLAGLETISGLSLVADGSLLHVFAASQASHGVAHLTVDLAQQGVVRVASSGITDGQSKADLLVGGIGADHLRGQAGDDTLIDGYGADTLTGGSGSDTFVLGADTAQDIITDFQPGQDRIDLSAMPFLYDPSRLSVTERAWGAELHFPGGEITQIHSANGQPLTAAQIFAAIDWHVDRPPLSLVNQLVGTDQQNTLEGTEGTDIIHGLGADDFLRGRAGDDQLEGGSGFDTLIGDEGHDLLYGGLGRDLVEAGSGNDTIEDRPQGGDLGRDTIWAGSGDDSISSGGGWDLVYGEDGHDWAYAGWGNDTLIGGTGNDTLLGVGGFDSIEGQGGNDELLGGNGNDWLSGGLGNDTILGGSNADYMLGGSGDDRLEGQHGFDTIFGEDGDDWIHGGLFNDRLFGGSGDDTLNGANDDDRLEGGYGNDHLIGGDGQDHVIGGYGADLLQGGNQNDTLSGGFGDDTLEGGFGADEIQGGFGHDWIHGGDMSDTIWGGGGNDTVNGGSGPDLIWLDDGDDLFNGFFQSGALGQDTIWGGAGNDTILASAGNDELHGEAEEDLLSGGQGNDALWGGTGADTLRGGQGNDTLHGGTGNDRLEAESGTDLLTGGAGADVFVFHDAAGRNTITDFTPGVDWLELNIAEQSYAEIDVVGAPRGLWVVWDGGEVLLEDLSPGDLSVSDVIFV